MPDGVIGVRERSTRFSFTADCSLSVERGSVILVYLNVKRSGKGTLVQAVRAGRKFNPVSLKVESIGR